MTDYYRGQEVIYYRDPDTLYTIVSVDGNYAKICNEDTGATTTTHISNIEPLEADDED